MAGIKINRFLGSNAAFSQFMPPPTPGLVTRPEGELSASVEGIGRPAESRPFAQFCSTKGTPSQELTCFSVKYIIKSIPVSNAE